MKPKEVDARQSNWSATMRNVEKIRRELDDLVAKATTPEVTAVQRSVAMGRFWQERINGNSDIYEVSDQLHVPVSEVASMWLRGKPNEFWTGSFPYQVSQVIGSQTSYLEFCATFGVEPFDPNRKPEAPQKS